MAWYSKDITLTKGGSASSPERNVIKIHKEVIHTVQILFPLGCAGLVKVRLKDGSHPFLPFDDGDFIKSDGAELNFKEFYEIQNSKEEIVVEAWNEDTIYNHTIQIRIGALPKGVLMPAFATEGILQALSSLFRRRD